MDIEAIRICCRQVAQNNELVEWLEELIAYKLTGLTPTDVIRCKAQLEAYQRRYVVYP